MLRQRLRKRLTALLLATFAVGLPPGSSLLDARERPTRAQAESHHEPGRCSWHHDHAACVQLAQSVALPSLGGSAPTSPRPDARSTARPVPLPPPTPPATTRHPRAPPTPHL